MPSGSRSSSAPGSSSVTTPPRSHSTQNRHPRLVATTAQRSVRCARADAYRHSAAAVARLRLSARPCSGIRTTRSARAASAAGSPHASLPNNHAVGRASVPASAASSRSRSPAAVGSQHPQAGLAQLPPRPRRRSDRSPRAGGRSSRRWPAPPCRCTGRPTYRQRRPRQRQRRLRTGPRRPRCPGRERWRTARRVARGGRARRRGVRRRTGRPPPALRRDRVAEPCQGIGLDEVPGDAGRRGGSLEVAIALGCVVRRKDLDDVRLAIATGEVERLPDCLRPLGEEAPLGHARSATGELAG